VNPHGAKMKSLLDVEKLSVTEFTLNQLQELHDNLAEELCMDQDAQTNNELFKRYVKAYDKLQELLVEYHERNNG
jgi:hypothetical protein